MWERRWHVEGAEFCSSNSVSCPGQTFQQPCPQSLRELLRLAVPVCRHRAMYRFFQLQTFLPSRVGMSFPLPSSSSHEEEQAWVVRSSVVTVARSERVMKRVAPTRTASARASLRRISTSCVCVPRLIVNVAYRVCPASALITTCWS